MGKVWTSLHPPCNHTFHRQSTAKSLERNRKHKTYIFSEEIVLQCAARLQPHSSLGILVRQEQSILSCWTQSFDLRQLVSERSTGINYGGLK